ncbi:MAG TPA: DUF4388 domain-containing protein, partial [Polyangiaceae bacterium]
MQLPGRLRLTTLGDVLGALHRAQASGALELVEVEGGNAGRSHRIHVRNGLVEDVETTLKHARIGEILTSDGLLSLAALGRIIARLTLRPSARVGEMVVEEGLGSHALVAAALRKQKRSRLEALFGLSEALLRFHVARPQRSGSVTPLTPVEFLHGRTRARQQGKRAPAPEASRASRPGTRSAIAPDRKMAAYRALGISTMASRGEVQRAFRRLA